MTKFDFGSMTVPLHGRFQCTFEGCCKDYSHRRQCEDHYCFTHLNTPRYRCDFCNKTFSFQENWKNHNKNTHNGNDMNNPLNDTSFPSTVTNSPRLQAQLLQTNNVLENLGLRRTTRQLPCQEPPPPPKLIPAPRVSHFLKNNKHNSPGQLPRQSTPIVKNPTPLKLILKVSPRSVNRDAVVSSFEDERSQLEIEAEEGSSNQDERMEVDVKEEESSSSTEVVSSTVDSYPSLRNRLSAPTTSSSNSAVPDYSTLPALKTPCLRCKCCSGYFLSRALFDRHVNLSEDS